MSDRRFTPVLTFVVQGESVSQGSLRAVPAHRNWMTIPGVRWSVTDAKPGLRLWRQKIVDAASEAWGERELLDEPVCVHARFVFTRPQSHYRKRKGENILRNDAPLYATSKLKGDLDKHLRALLDALTGVVFRDDSLVTALSAEKVYGAEPYVIASVKPLLKDSLHRPTIGVESPSSSERD